MIRSRNSVAGINSSSTIYYDHREYYYYYTGLKKLAILLSFERNYQLVCTLIVLHRVFLHTLLCSITVVVVVIVAIRHIETALS